MLGAIEYDYRTLTGWPSPATIPATITAVSTTDAFQNADVTSAALPVPSGTAVGDLLLARITTSSPNFGASSSVTAPSGWTAIVTVSNLTATTASLFYRVATAADTSAPSYTFTLGSQSFWSGGITRFTGVDTTTPIDVAAKTATGAPLTLPALTTVATGAYVVSYVGMDGAVDATWSHPLPSGWTNLFSETTGNNIGALSTHASGTVPSATWNWSGGGGGTDMAGIIVSLRPRNVAAATTPVVVQQVTGSAASAANFTTGTVTTTAGNVVALVVGRSGGLSTGSITSVTDTTGNTWTKATTGSVSNGTNSRVELWYTTQNVGALTGGTITANSGTAQTNDYSIIELSGVNRSAPLTASSPDGSGGTSATPQTPAVTAHANDLVLSVVHHTYNAAADTVSDSGWTLLTPSVNGTAHLTSAAYQVQSAAGTIGPTWTRGGGTSSANGLITASFAAAASGGAAWGTVTPPYQQDFTGNDGNVWPGEWTTASTTGAVDYQSNRGRLLTASGASSRGAKAYLTGLAGTTDFDVTVDVSFPAISDESLTVFFRTSDTVNATTAPANAYGLVLLPNSAGYAIYKWVNGTATNLSGVLPYTWTAGTARRFRVTGNTLPGSGYTLAVTQWDPTQAQPAVIWSGSDTTVTGTGSVLLMPQVGATGSAAITAYVDNIVLAVPQVATSSTVTGVGTGSSTLAAGTFDTISSGTLSGVGTGTSTLASPPVTVTTTLAASGTGTAAFSAGTTPSFPQKIALASYIYPDWYNAGGGVWGTRITPYAGLINFAIINPASGSGTASNSDYQTQVTRNVAAGLTTIGYVATGYFTGTKTLAQMKTEVDNYYAWYPGIDGIFFDETSSAAAQQPNYLALYNYVKAKSGTRKLVVINPGVPPDESYMSACDVAITFEGDYTAYTTRTQGSWEPNYPPTRFWHLIYNTPYANLAATLARSVSQRAGSVYVTDDILDNPWDTIPADPYWSDERAQVTAASIGGGVNTGPALAITGVLTGTGTASSSIGSVSISTSLAASGTGSSTLSGAATNSGTLSATGTGSAALSGFRSTTATLAATGTGSATVTGFSTVSVTLTASGTGSSTVTVTHTVFGTLTGTGAGNAVLSGQLAISGLLTPTGTGSSSLVDPVPLTITGTLTAVAVGTSSLNTFSSVGVGTMTLTGFNTTTGAPVPAVAVGSSTLTGFVTTTRTVTGTGTGTASITGGVTEVGLLTPTGTGTATLSSGPGSVPASVAATGTGSATLSGFRSTTGTLAASGIGTEALAVTHTVTATFAAAGVGTSAILNVGLGTTVAPFGVGSATLTGFESRTAVLAASGSGSVTVPFDFTAGPADTLGATGTVTVTRTTPGTPADPSAIASLYQRYVAADIGAAAGAAVTSWTPRTGTGTLTGTGTYQTTGSLINGKPAVRFNGTSNTFTGTIGSAGTTAATVVVVFATTSSAQQELVQISQCETIINSGDSLQLWSGVNLSSTATVSTGTPHVAAFGTNTSSANYIMLDGTQVASGNAGTPSTGTAFRIGTASGSTRYLNGDVAEVLVFNTQLTAADLATVDSYVQATYGITTADSTPTGNVSTSGSADVAGLTDAATDVQGLVRTPADTEGITDAVSVVRTVFNTAPASTIAVTDAVARGFGRTIADTEGLTDVGGKAQSVLVPDTLGLTDAEAVYGVFALPVTTTAAPDLETRVGLNDVVSLRGVADVPVDLTGNLVKGPQRAVIDIEAGSSDLTHVVALSGTASVDTAMPKPRLRVVARMSDVLTTQVSGVVQTLVLGNNGPIYGDPDTTVFSDDFSAVRSDLWTYGPTTTVSGGQLVCPCNTSWSSTAVSKAAFDLTGSIIQGQMLSIAGGVADGSGADSWFSIDNNPVSNDNGFNIDISEGQITPSYNIGGVFTSGPSIPYVAARHKWFRYRQAAGTVYFEVSADALSWTALWSWVPTFSITSMYVLLGNGTPAPTAQQPTTYDNVSVLHPGGGPAATGGFETTSTHTETVVWSDDFDSVRSELWTFHSGATVTGGQLSCPFGWLISNNPVSLIGSAIAVQLVSTQTNADGWLSYQAADNSRYLGWEVTGGTLSVNYRNPGGGDVMPWSTAYTPAVHAWLRVRERSGTVYFETSADGTTWTVCYSTPTSTFTFDLTSQIIWLGNDTGGTTTFDNFTVSRIGAPVPTAVYGPTNKPVWKLARNFAVPGGWGSYIAADVFDDVPAGATVTISLYVRGPVGEKTDLHITNDSATDTVLDPPALPMLAAHDGSWKHYTATVTLPKTWIANLHRLRLGINNWIEWSDATLTVSMPMQMHGLEPEPQPEPVTDPPRKLDRVFVVLR